MIDIDDAYLTIYSGQDYADAITRVLRIAEPEAQIHLGPTGRTLPAKLVWMDGDRNWFREAEELAQAVGMRLKKVSGVWFLAPSQSMGSWVFG